MERQEAEFSQVCLFGTRFTLESSGFLLGRGIFFALTPTNPKSYCKVSFWVWTNDARAVNAMYRFIRNNKGRPKIGEEILLPKGLAPWERDESSTGGRVGPDIASREKKNIRGKVTCHADESGDAVITVEWVQEPWPIQAKPVQSVSSKKSEPENVQLTWTILPPDSDLFCFLTHEGRSEQDQSQPDPEQRERLTHLASLGPIRWWRGVPLHGTREYLVAEFKDWVVAECPLYGNAMYVCRKEDSSNWQQIFELTKSDARTHGAIRIVHAGNWKLRLNQTIG